MKTGNQEVIAGSPETCLMGSQPLKNLQYRLLLSDLKKAGVISQSGVRELIRVMEEVKVEFLPLTIQQRKSMEMTLMKLLADGNSQRLERQTWALRARFARGHALAHSCLKLDCYADEVDQGAALKMVHVYLLIFADPLDSIRKRGVGQCP